MNLLLEWLTHALLGALVAEWFLGKKIGNVAFQWGALLGTAPDLLEIPPALFLGTARMLQWDQGPMHSLAAATLAAWALSSVFAKSWKKQKVTRSNVFWWVLTTWILHTLLDTLTVDGASILWPVLPRISFNLLQAFGPVPVLLMALTIIRVGRLTTKKQLVTRHKTLVRGCLLTTLWFLFCLSLKWISTAGFDADLKRRNVKVSRRMETPVAYNLLLRRAVVQGDGSFSIGYRSVFEPFSSPVKWTIYPAAGSAQLAFQPDEGLLRLHTILSRHTDGWLLERTHSLGFWIADLRHTEHRVWGEKKGMVDSRFSHAWNVLIESRGDAVQRVYDTRHKPMESTRRMMARTFMNTALWEATPRLAGVTGSAPEFLHIEE